MSESFTLEGSGGEPPKQRRLRPMTILVVLILLAGGAWLVMRILENRELTYATPGRGPLHQNAEARKRAFEEIFPGARLPEPFVIRGARELGEADLVWMYESFPDTHAYLLRGPAPLTQTQVEGLLRGFVGERLPSRELLDEEGVQIERRAPFAEEFREPPSVGKLPVPPTDWVGEWSEVQRALGKNEEQPSLSFSIDLAFDEQHKYRMAPFRQLGPHWWATVDLGSALDTSGEALYLVYFQRTRQAPTTANLHGFVTQLLRL